MRTVFQGPTATARRAMLAAAVALGLAGCTGGPPAGKESPPPVPAPTPPYIMQPPAGSPAVPAPPPAGANTR